MDFSKQELIRFANIFDNAGQVFLAGLVIAPFFSGIDFNKVVVIPSGLVFTFGCWYISWWVTRRINKR